jgi:monovalent cation:H+ antiporter-2, CPA2 family
MTFSPLEITVVILAMAVITLIVTQRLRFPAVIGYLVLGLIMGPSGVDLIHENNTLHLLAELGVVFLLFAIGLEVSLTEIIRMRRSVVVVGGVQVLACMIIPGITAYFLGMSLGTGFVAAAALSLSSTAIVVKQLAENKSLMTKHGEMSLAILLFQDLAAIPFLIIIPVLGSSAMGMAHDLAWALLKGVTAILGLLLAGRFILRPLFDEVARSKSDELFTLTTLLVAMATAWASDAMGLSMALGAFMAGLVLGESHHKRQIQGYIRPFRDLFLGLFFVTIGMLLNIEMVIKYWYWVLFLVVSIIAFKSVVIAWVVYKIGHLQLNESIQTGLIMAHGGEFGFVLLSLAIQLGVMEADYGQVVLAGVLITLFLSPFMIDASGSIARRLSERLQ